LGLGGFLEISCWPFACFPFSCLGLVWSVCCFVGFLLNCYVDTISYFVGGVDWWDAALFYEGALLYVAFCLLFRGRGEGRGVVC